MNAERDGVRRLVLVVGIGRSGTSLLSGILARLGFRVPQPEVRMNDTNPRGFGEPRWVVDFHSRLMRGRRVTVFDSRPRAWETMDKVARDDAVFDELRSWLAVQSTGADNVVIKDPRIGWFLPVWLRAADDLGLETSFVTMLRRPPEVVASARRWYGAWQNDASRAAAWLNITLETERATRGARRAFIRYADLLDDWRREISRAAAPLDLPWLAGLDRPQYPEVDSFVEPSLRRSVVGWDEVSVPATLRAMIDDVWEHVSRLAERDNDEAACAALDSARSAYVTLYAEAEAIAQSSIRAAKPRGGGAKVSRSRRIASRARHAVGPRVSSLVPRRAGRRVGSFRDKLEAGTGLPLPLRVMLLMPARVRERVPTPLLRAGHRLVRAVRR
jgi:hypothetical protein